MILAEKIIKLRKKMEWSQEELAMRVGVSRQSVSKWESTASIPDLDKILQLSELFGVSCDYLLKDTMEEPEITLFTDTEAGEKVTVFAEEKSPKKQVSLEEANTYMEMTKKAAVKIAAGVSACILSPVVLILLGGLVDAGILGMTEDMASGLGVLVLLVIVACAVGVFIVLGMQLDKYEYLEKELERVCKKLFNSTMFNFTCLMNNAYRDDTTPNVHFHFFPRYKKEVKLISKLNDIPVMEMPKIKKRSLNPLVNK